MKAVVLGGNGLLGQALMHTLAKENFAATAITRNDFDIFNPKAMQEALDKIQPDLIFNTVAYTQVDLAEDHPKEAMQVNRAFPAMLGGLIKNSSCHLIHYSTDFLFHGSQNKPFTEASIPNPKSVYGSTKLAGEQALLSLKLDNCTIIRTAWLFGPGRKNFVQTILNLAKERDVLNVVHDQFGSPTYTPDLAKASLELAKLKASGIFNVVNSGQACWCELAAEAIALANLPCTIRGIPSSEYPQKALRPPYSVLDTHKFTQLTQMSLRPWIQALREYIFTSFLPEK